MNYNCPKNCSQKVIRHGTYFRKSDSRVIQRFKCQGCRTHFSKATFSECYRQKKRRVNELLFKLLCSGVSMRRAALILNIHRVTVARKFEFLARRSEKRNLESLKKMEDSVTHLQFDDLITSHHTKLKPLSVSIAVDVSTRRILDLKVSQIPAFGHLARTSRLKYGYRRSEHLEGLRSLFKEIKGSIATNVLIECDEHKLYPKVIAQFLPSSKLQTYKSIPSSIVGQGELKRSKRDPLFVINHTLAMLRANINRLFRRTWCTTKKPQRLAMHLMMYQEFHNNWLV